MASAVGTKRKAAAATATIARVVKFDRGCATSVLEAEGWAAKWGAKLEALTLPKTGVGEDYRAESMRSPRGGLIVDSDGSMQRQLIASIREERAQRNKMLIDIWESDKVPPYMDERERQLRYRISAFRKKRTREGQDFRNDLVPAWTNCCALCSKEIPHKDQGLVGDYMWGCSTCRVQNDDHTLRNTTRVAIDHELTDLLTDLPETSELHALVKELSLTRDRIVERAREKEKRIKRRVEEISNRAPGAEAENQAFETIYNTPVVNAFDSSKFSLEELKALDTYETKLLIQVLKQHRSVFFEENLEELITYSVTTRQKAFIRHNGPTEALKPEDGIRLWESQGGKCDGCQEQLHWNWAVGGRARLAQLDRVDVTKRTYVNNSVWLCQCCNMSKGVEVDMLAYDRHFLEALTSARASLGDGGNEDVAVSALIETRDLQKSRAVLDY
jgi:hypothetical protein